MECIGDWKMHIAYNHLETTLQKISGVKPTEVENPVFLGVHYGMRPVGVLTT
jgi:hypothetical protein